MEVMVVERSESAATLDSVNGSVLVGPFLTRAEAADLAGVDTDAVARSPELLRLTGLWLEETYFAFQFDDRGIRRDVAQVVDVLKDVFDDETIADWLVTPLPLLDGQIPLTRLVRPAGLHRVLAAAAAAALRSREGLTVPAERLVAGENRAPLRSWGAAATIGEAAPA